MLRDVSRKKVGDEPRRDGWPENIIQTLGPLLKQAGVQGEEEVVDVHARSETTSFSHLDVQHLDQNRKPIAK